jgi:hypothetical protein
MAQYVRDIISGKVETIVTQDGLTTIPIDATNSKYAEIMRQVADGELVIQEADP